MKKRFNLLVVAIAVLPNLCFAGAMAHPDTVKVINNPNQVVITQGKDTVLLKVDGNDVDKDYHYECRVTPNYKGGLSTMHREGLDVEFSYPFKKERDSVKSDDTKPRFQVFLSDVYIGWGGFHADAVNRDAFKKTACELGVLNLVGVGYLFNQNRSRVSLGLGFNLSRYGLKKPHFWACDDTGVLDYETSLEDHDHHYASLSLLSMQFPLMFNQSLGKRWCIAASAVLNWNYYADFNNSYSIGKSDYSINTRGLHQRKVSVDYIGMVSWRGIGAYFRYAPQSVFKTNYGPEMKNRWTLGVIIRSWR